MAFDPTPNQEKAIYAKGSTLVSAAAGSGKTAVLVERVIQKLTDEANPVPADRMLIVTFTNAAALELRTRIEQRFEEELKADPTNVSLAKQKQMLAAASICTIDSFCIDLVRENFQKARVNPDFKISDSSSLRAVDEKVADRMIADLFASGDPVFLDLLDIIGAEYDEKNFRDTVLTLYDFSRQLPDPDAWFDSISLPYQEGFSRSGIFDACFRIAQNKAKEAICILAPVMEWMKEDEPLATYYFDDLSHANELLPTILSAADEKKWDEIYDILTEFLTISLRRSNGLKSPNKELAKAAWEKTQKEIGHLAKLFYDRENEIEKQFCYLAAPLSLLSEILKRFEAELLEEYRKRNTLTFHNTEHLALSLLKTGEAELLDRFDEVMVDEYQDTNDLQDTIFSILSCGERLFAVGDVKQSIYGFRGANPKNFLQKSKQAVRFGTAKAGETQKLILAENFRSHPAVCHAVNYFFSMLMTGEEGGLIYDADEELVPAAAYPESPLSHVDFDLIEYKANAQELRAVEGKHIAEKIKEIMAMPPCIRVDKETLRKAEYGDFAILLRTVDGKTAELAQALRNEGIPVNLRTDHYADSLEIETFLSLLNVIDNPDSDVDLLTVLSSPIFGFSDEELANLRIQNRDGTLYTVILLAAQQGDEHARLFLRSLEQYRRLSVVFPLATFLSRLLNLTDYLNIVSAMENGERRRNNLLLLLTLAESYAADRDGSLRDFTDYVAKQSDSGLRGGVSAGNSVRIMTVHASKGLQFPVCIVAGVSNKFNFNDQKQSLVYSANGGIGIRYYDEAASEKRTTPSREVICEEMALRAREEEQRLLYVALTRAQDQLIITYTVKDLEKALAKRIEELMLCGGRVDLAARSADCYGKWLLSALLLHPDAKQLRPSGSNLIPVMTDKPIRITVVSGSVAEEKKEQPETVREPDQAIVAQLKENMEYVYPYEALLDIQAKSSVTAIANKAERAKFAFSDRPAFMSDGNISATERGTAMHKIMQFFDFDKVDAIEEEIDRLYEWQYISEREKDSINRSALKTFFASSVFARIKKAGNAVWREMRFLTEIPAGQIDPALGAEASGEGVMVQGAVDLCFKEEDSIVILDFKTDRVGNADELRDAYREQLGIYALACEKIFERPVRQTLLYSFALGKEIEV